MIPPVLSMPHVSRAFRARAGSRGPDRCRGGGSGPPHTFAQDRDTAALLILAESSGARPRCGRGPTPNAQQRETILLDRGCAVGRWGGRCPSPGGLGHERFTSIDRVDNDGRDLVGAFHSDEWGDFRTYFNFQLSSAGKIVRLDIGQAK
jgi:hypothetical protein